MLQNRQYHENSTPEEVKAIQDRIQPYTLDKRIILYKELPKPTYFSIKICWSKVESLTQEIPRFAIAADLSEMEATDAIIRKAIKENAEKFSNRLIYSAFFIGKNTLLFYMLKLLSFAIQTNIPYSIVPNLEEGIQVSLQKLNAHQNKLKT